MLELIPFGGYPRSFRNHFREMDSLERALFNDSFFSDSSALSSDSPNPIRTDVRKTDDGYMLEAELPGFKKEDISVDIENDILTIKAHKNRESEEKTDSYVRMERSYGEYQRSFSVRGIDTEAVKAKYENGILSLTLPALTPVEPPVKQLAIE